MINRGALKTTSIALLLCSVAMLGWSTHAEAQLPARLFTTGAHNEIRFASGGASWCVRVEPIGGNFAVTDIDPCTVLLISNGTGSVSQISYDCTKPTLVGDGDSNGVQDIEFCFLKTSMHPLFDNLHGRKPKTVTLTVTGDLLTGGSFTGNITLQLYLMD